MTDRTRIIARRLVGACPTCGARGGLLAEQAYGAAAGHDRVHLICRDPDCSGSAMVDIDLATGVGVVVDRETALRHEPNTTHCPVPGCAHRRHRLGMCRYHRDQYGLARDRGEVTSPEEWLAIRKQKGTA